LIAFTAVEVVPWPDIITTAAVGSASRRACKVSRPSRSASQISRKTTEGRFSS
jgi:hypothetical protein